MKLPNCKESAGWVYPEKWASSELLEILNEYAKEVREKADIFVLIGVGGSNQAARAVIEGLALEGGPQILYAGNQLSALEMERLFKKLEGKSVYINIIAKNFETLEPGVAFRILRTWMKKEYGETYAERIFATGTKGSSLEQLCMEKGYRFLEFPEDIGGRYSAISSVGLFPMAVAGVDIRELVQGAIDVQKEIEADTEESHPVYAYAKRRCQLYQEGCRIELLTYFEPSLQRFSRWWIQLFAESEGKEDKGLYPAAFQCTEDLHSVGQFVQDGTPIIFETFLDVQESAASVVVEKDDEKDGFDYLAGKDLNEINRMAQEAVWKAHEARNTCLRIPMGELNAYWFGRMFYFFEYACFLSAEELGVNPFDQPGVEDYKKLLFRTLGK